MERHDGNVIGCLCGVYHISIMVLNHMLEPTYFKLKLEDIALESMTFILNDVDYLHVGLRMEFQGSIKWLLSNKCDKGSRLLKLMMRFIFDLLPLMFELKIMKHVSSILE